MVILIVFDVSKIYVIAHTVRREISWDPQPSADVQDTSVSIRTHRETQVDFHSERAHAYVLKDSNHKRLKSRTMFHSTPTF